MTKWDFSVDSNSKRDNWHQYNVKANSFEEAIAKLSKKELQKALIAVKEGQKRLDYNCKHEPKHLFEATISTLTEFGDQFIPLGVNLKSIKANTLEELNKKLKQLDVKELKKKSNEAYKSKENIEMFVLQKKSEFSGIGLNTLTDKDLEKILKNKTKSTF
jgi:hypothetical protein